MERRLFELKFPELADLDRPRSQEDWRRLAQGIRSWAVEVSKIEFVGDAVKAKPLITQHIAPERLAQARIYLRDTVKLPAEQVQAMSGSEVEVRYTIALQREIENDYEKWFLVPYAQSLPEVEKHNAALQAEGERRELYPLTSILVPIKSNLIASEARGPRRIAIYQVIEAIRMHAAERGSLPGKLEDVTVVPVPVDPGSGKPFSYTLDAGVATLDAPFIIGAEHESLRLPVRIKLRSK